MMMHSSSADDDVFSRTQALYENVYDPRLDDRSNENASKRGEEITSLFSLLSALTLRVGFLLQLAALVAGGCCFLLHGGKGLFTFDLFGLPERLRSSEDFMVAMLFCDLLYLFGALSLATFQVYLPDSSKAVRGFRVGSKILSAAATLDCFAAALRLTQHAYAYNWLAKRWWFRNVASSSDWTAWHLSAFVHSLALLLFGLGIFYTESYHPVGVSHEWAILLLSVFAMTAALEFVLTFFDSGSYFVVANFAALACALLWALKFEPIVQQRAPALHDRDVNSGFDHE